MMLVENKDLTIQIANETANKLLSIIQKDISNPAISDDPAESILLFIHTLALTLSKSVATLIGYRSIYGIEKLTPEDILTWVFQYAKGYTASILEEASQA